jgi:hypothetical protein
MGWSLFIFILSMGFYLYSIPFIGRLSVISVCEAAKIVDWIQGDYPSIGVDQATTVTISVQVEPDPALIPTSINLIRYDSTGKAIANLGTLYDDGTHGDTIAGDNIFTSQIEFNEPFQTTIYLKASVAYRGLLKRIFSTTLAIPVIAVAESNRTVGPEGGTLQFDNGVILQVPAGAVTEVTAITVKDLPCSWVDPILNSNKNFFHPKRCLGGFSAEPIGLVFQVPVTATVPVLRLKPGEVPIQLTVDIASHTYNRGPTDLFYYGDQGVAEMKILHFSGQVVTAELHVLPLPENPCDG